MSFKEAMQTDTNLTIFIPLKDRVQYTLRFLKSMEDARCPYKIILADGGQDKDIQDLLESKKYFKNLNYDYIRYPYDANFDLFYEKMHSGLSTIDTPFTMVMDNDDFVSMEGVANCLKILQEGNWSSSRGRIDDRGGRNIYALYPDHVLGETCEERILDQTVRFHSNWHNVTHTKFIKACWSMINIVKPNNFRITEQLTAYLNIAWGNGYRGDFPWIIRDDGERIVTESGSLQDHFPAQDVWLNADYWPQEFNKMVEVIAACISYHDGINFEEARDLFYDNYWRKLPQLKDLINSRISDAKKLGYSKDRVDKLLKVCDEYGLK